MSFSADWLTTRRAADHRSRNPDIGSRLAQHFASSQNIRVLDLGCGTGSNMIATAPLLPGSQHWTLVDNDPALLERIAPVAGVRFDTVKADLAGHLDKLLGQRFDLITASALFDLAGSAFIDKLVRHVAQMSAAFHTVLTYDGEEEWHPVHPDDARVLAAFHKDQHSDKGLGPALGPDATDHLKARFTAAGYKVLVGKSDWHLAATEDAPLIGMLTDGIQAATVPDLGEVADAWHRDRISAGSVRIGHKDLIALPANT